MKRTIIAAITAVAALAIAAAPAATGKPSDYSTAKKNKFYKVAVAMDPDVKYAGKKNVIDLGVSTCDLLRAGGDMSDLAAGLYATDASDTIISIVATAPVVLCPDQQYKFD